MDEKAAAAMEAQIAKAKATIDWVHRILKEERNIVIESKPLEATAFQVENIRWAYVFYESGLSINVLYTIDDQKKRAVGFKLSDGMEIPEELSSFKFARQRSKRSAGAEKKVFTNDEVGSSQEPEPVRCGGFSGQAPSTPDEYRQRLDQLHQRLASVNSSIRSRVRASSSSSPRSSTVRTSGLERLQKDKDALEGCIAATCAEARRKDIRVGYCDNY